MNAKPILSGLAALSLTACGSLPKVTLVKPTVDPDTGAVRLGVEITPRRSAETEPIIDYTDPGKGPVDVDAVQPGDDASLYPVPGDFAEG